ncbi:MAG: phenylalanine--tRNA ligase subunit alpha [Saprospirales bacterium]|nr:MAG: phenylalanine--tRNA ligase subunit alpha [Saprospirales bacterium]
MNEEFNTAEQLLEQIKTAELNNSEELESFRIKYLGSKNEIKPLFSKMGSLKPEDRKAYGQLLNKLKNTAEERYKTLKPALEQREKHAEYRDIDLTAPPAPIKHGARHPVDIVMNRVISIFQKMGFLLAEDREIEDDWHNFTAMNTPEDHPARDMQDTYYLRDFEGLLLRTHTSSVQARVMTSTKPPIRIIAPGRVYRNETISARSHCQFHQVEGLYIDRDVSFADLKQTLLHYAREMYGPNAKIRLRPSYFPFTEPSAEVDVYWGLESETDKRITKGTGWLEIMGCGMVDPQVLENCGIDPNEYSGFAFGMGIERQALLQYRIEDIRWLFENDIRFLKQFHPAI